MKTHPAYLQSVNAITAHVSQVQANLDQAATDARTAHINALRRAPLDGVHASDPLYPLASLLSASLTVGRDDGYPEVTLPEETKAVLSAAYRAGLLPVESVNGNGWERVGKIGAMTVHFHCNDSRQVHVDSLPEWKADYEAYEAARTYRQRQRVAELI